MAVATSRTYADVTHNGASVATSILRVPVGLDADDYADTNLEVFLAVEATGTGAIDRT